MFFRRMSLAAYLIGVFLPLGIPLTTIICWKFYDINSREMAWISLGMNVLLTVMAVAIFGSNKIIKIMAVNVYEALHGDLDEEDRAAIKPTYLPCIRFIGAGPLLICIFFSIISIHGAATSKVEGDIAFCIVMYGLNIGVAFAFFVMMFFPIYRDLEVTYLADDPNLVQPIGPADQGIQMQQLG